MRRGAPIAEGKLPVVSPHPADLESADIESMAEGGGYDKSYKVKQSPSSGFGLSIPTGGLSLGVGNTMNGGLSSNSSHSSLNVSKAYGVSSNMAGWNRIIFSSLTKYDPGAIQQMYLVVFGLAFVLFWILPLTPSILVCIYAAVAFGVLGSLFLSRSVLECDDGTEAMRAVSDPIREGAEGFLSVQYSVSFKNLLHKNTFDTKTIFLMILIISSSSYFAGYC